MKLRRTLEALLEKNPDGIAVSFSLRSPPAMFTGAVRRSKDGADGVFEAVVQIRHSPNGADQPVLLFFDGDDLATLMVPIEPSAIVAPGGRTFGGLRS